LFVGGETFRERLRGFVRVDRMKSVGLWLRVLLFMVDKRPSFWKGDSVRKRIYGDAVREVEVMWRVGSDICS
jgi:hypothetical protein